MELALREKCPNTELFLVRIWALFAQCSITTFHIETSKLTAVSTVNGTFNLHVLFFETNSILCFEKKRGGRRRNKNRLEKTCG